jgi:hypothetical protein
VPATTLERTPTAIGSAQDILERLERCAGARRARGAVGALRMPAAPVERVHRFDPATVDLFPYDLLAMIAAAAATIVVGIVFVLPLALGFAAALLAFGAWSRHARWFPGVGTNLVIGAVVGAVLVVVS